MTVFKQQLDTNMNIIPKCNVFFLLSLESCSYLHLIPFQFFFYKLPKFKCVKISQSTWSYVVSLHDI